MSIFGLPTGEFDLLLKKRGRGRHKEEWKNVMFTDFITQGEIAECVEDWSRNYKVVAARYNGKKIAIPTNYHWEHKYKDVVYGRYKTRAEVVAAMEIRKTENYKKPVGEKQPIGTPVFVKD